MDRTPGELREKERFSGLLDVGCGVRTSADIPTLVTHSLERLDVLLKPSVRRRHKMESLEVPDKLRPRRSVVATRIRHRRLFRSLVRGR